MKKILLIMPDYYGFDEVVFNGLKKYSNDLTTNLSF